MTVEPVDRLQFGDMPRGMWPKEWSEVDYYAVLGVARNAKTRDIERAYRDLVAQWQPHVQTDPNASTALKRLTSAHDTLANPYLRRDYDKIYVASVTRTPVDGAAASAAPVDPMDRLIANEHRNKPWAAILLMVLFTIGAAALALANGYTVTVASVAVFVLVVGLFFSLVFVAMNTRK